MTGLPYLRQSERAAFKRCQWAWYQSHVKGLAPLVERKDAADFGTYFHVALAEYYPPGVKRGPHPSETWDVLTKDHITKLRIPGADDEEIATWEDFRTLGFTLADAYVERYQGDPHWEILDSERRFKVTIPDVRVQPLKSKNGKLGYTPIVFLVGTFDVCLRDHNELDSKGRPLVKAVDHKTTNRIFTSHLSLDEQASTYIAVATHVLRQQGLIENDQVVKGMEYNFVKRAGLDTRVRDEKGLARNNPQKKHYVDAIMYGDVSTPYTDASDEAKLMKLKLPELNDIAETYGVTVYGAVSANQNGDNFLRYFVPRTPKERQRTIVRISEEARVMDMVRKGELPLLKTPQKDCNFCKFFDLCELDESGGDAEYFISTVYKQNVDPYFDHREDAVNSKKVTNA